MRNSGRRPPALLVMLWIIMLMAMAATIGWYAQIRTLPTRIGFGADLPRESNMKLRYNISEKIEQLKSQYEASLAAHTQSTSASTGNQTGHQITDTTTLPSNMAEESNSSLTGRGNITPTQEPAHAKENDTICVDAHGCNMRGVCFHGKCYCEPWYQGLSCQNKTNRPVVANKVSIRGNKMKFPVGDTYWNSSSSIILGPDIIGVLPDDDTVLEGREIPVYNTCAIVASSGDLLMSDFGAEIDAHDMVMRFNNPPVGLQYARFVGTKTTFDFWNIYVLRAISEDPRRWRGASKGILFHARSHDWVFEYARFVAEHGEYPLLLVDTEMLKPAYDLWNAAYNKTDKFPTTGYFGMYIAMRLCDKIDLYGFFDHPDPNVKNRYSYYTARKPDSWSHDQTVEKQLVGLFQQYKDIKLHYSTPK